MKLLISLIVVSIILSGCGLKRPLELPGHEKNKSDTTSTDMTAQQPQQPDTATPDTGSGQKQP